MAPNYTFDQPDSPVISVPYERHATPKVTPKHNDAIKICLKLHLDKKDIVGVQRYYNYVLTEHHTKNNYTYTNCFVNADLFYANFTKTTFQKEPRYMYLTLSDLRSNLNAKT